MPPPAAATVGLARQRGPGDVLDLDEARPEDEPRLREPIDGLEDDACAPRLEAGLLVELPERAVDRRLARQGLTARERPRAAPMRRKALADEHAAVTDDEHADAGE